MSPRSSSTDVVIVGGGVIGLAIAWRASAAGLTVTVCDPAPGTGASWAAAGMLAPVGEAHSDETGLMALGLASVARWPSFAAEVAADSGEDPGLRQEGTLHVGFDEDDRRAIRELLAVHRSLGLDSEWRTARECRQLEPALAPVLRGGIEVRGDWQVDNRALVSALVKAVDQRGGQLRRTAVRQLRVGAARVEGVELDDGETLAAGTVVLAAGAHSPELPGLPPAARPPIRPVKGEILRLQADPTAPILTRAVRASAKGRAVYLVPRRHGELVVGATMEEVGFDPAVRAGAVHDLLVAAVDAVPGVADLPLTETLARFRPTTPDNAPVLGPTPVPGLLLATGHHRNGVLLTPVTADALTDVLVGGALPDVAAPFTLERFS